MKMYSVKREELAACANSHVYENGKHNTKVNRECRRRLMTRDASSPRAPAPSCT